MGRRKIEIKPILDPKTLLVTFAKRKVGLFNKAYELSVLCKCKVAVLVVTNRDRVHKFASTKFDEILEEANRSKHPPDVTDCRKPLKKHRKRVADLSTPRHSVSGTEDPAENSSPQTPDSSTPLCGRRNSIYQNCLTSPVNNARDNVADRYAPSAPPPSARDVPDSAAPISYVMANGPKVPLLEIPQPSHFLESNVTAQPVSSDTILSSSCASFTPSAAAEPCPPVVTPIASGLRSIYEFPILTSLPASAPASNQHPVTEISMTLPPPAAAHGSLLPLVPSSPPTSQQPEMTADSPRFLATTVTKTEDPTPTPTVTESRQDMEPENLFKTTASAEANQQKDFKQRSRSVSSRPLPAITANALEVQNFVRPFESEAPSTFFARTKGILPKMSVRKELRGSEETLKTPVIFTTKADIWPPFQMNIINGMESLVELPSMSTTAGAVNTTTDVKRQAEEEEEKEDNEEEECGREAVSSRKRITYPFDERLIGEPGSPSQPKRQLLREEGTT